MAIESAADFVRMTRDALAASGFVRERVGESVVWTGGDPSKPVVVLIHGANDQAGTWFAVAPRLASRFHVIAADLAGHGESGPSVGPLPIPMLAARLGEVIGERRVTLIGNSLGGFVALLYALDAPRNVERLVLEAGGGLSRPLSSPTRATTREEALLILRNVHGQSYVPPEWSIEALLQRSIDSPMLRLTEAQECFVDARLGEISLPTTLIWGADDGVLPLAYAEELQDGIRGAKLHVIEGAGHIPHLQQPEKFLECLSSIF